MTIREALREGWSALTGSDTETPQLDTSLLLSHACGISREKLYMDLPEELDEKRLELFRANMKRRISGEPVAWIIGNKEFWGLDFKVGPGVLCPRPDSEILIESALEIMGKKKSGSLHDCCTGPGTLALTLASERPSWDISASDISVLAADFFKANNQKLTGSRVRYTHSDLMNGINETFDVIVSNPPYLTPVEMGDKVALGWKEPDSPVDSPYFRPPELQSCRFNRSRPLADADN